MNIKNFCFILSAFLIFILNFSCKNKHAAKDAIIVQKPAEMDDKISETLQDVLQYASDNNGKINDSIRLYLTPVVNNFYQGNEYKNIWSTKETWNPLTDSLLNFIRDAELYGLFPSDYHFKDLENIKNKIAGDTLEKMNATVWTKADLMLTDAFMQIEKHLKEGRLFPDSISIRKDSALTVFFVQNLNTAIKNKNISDVLNNVEPKHQGYIDLKKGIRRFLDSMDRRIYMYVVYPNKDSLTMIKKLQKRLQQSGYIQDEDKLPDSVQLSLAIKKAQKAKGIKADGKISSSFIKSLNTTDVEKYKRIAITLDRYKQLPDSLPEKYIWVNLPGYYMKVWDHDTIAISSKVIVGKPTTRTPTLTGKISDMVTYPRWTIPNSIIKKDILPALKKNPGYLARKGFNLFDSKDETVDPYSINWAKYTKGIPFKIRQGSGDDNALGILKFNFNNPYDVYLHDTNQRYLFKNSSRALSHGCVRVQEWEKLAFFIAKNDSLNLKPADTLTYNTDSLKNWLANKERKKIIVKNRLPLFIRYFTCEGKDGKVIFYDDIYGEDKLLRDKYFANK